MPQTECYIKKKYILNIFTLLNYNENNFNILYKFPVKVETFLNQECIVGAFKSFCCVGL